MIFSPRHAVSGAARLIMHGPVSILESIGLWRGRIRSDARTLRAAELLLMRLVTQRNISIAEIDHKQSAAMLTRIGFAKLDRSQPARLAICVTAAGRDAAQRQS
jgi:hypothetical protein